MISEKEEAILLKNFNRRIEKDFGKVYSLFYNDLFYFAAKLYQHTEVEPRDAIHDIFLQKKYLHLTINYLHCPIFFIFFNNISIFFECKQRQIK